MSPVEGKSPQDGAAREGAATKRRMAIPWEGIFDLAIGLTQIVRQSKRSIAVTPESDVSPEQQLSSGTRAIGQLESHLAGVVVAALREAFDRDTRRLELEREQMDAERARAERALALEWQRQAGERELGRLRLIAGVAIVSWLGTLFLATRFAGMGPGVRVTVGVGWTLMIAALAEALAGQSRISSLLDRIDETERSRDGITGGLPGAVAPWLLVAGLMVIALALTIS